MEAAKARLAPWLAAAHFSSLYGRASVYQAATSEGSGDEIRKDLRGRVMLWDDHPLTSLDVQVQRGSTIKATNLTEEFTLDDFAAENGEDSTPIGVLEDVRLETYHAARAAVRHRLREPHPGLRRLLLHRRLLEMPHQPPSDRRRQGARTRQHVHEGGGVRRAGRARGAPGRAPGDAMLPRGLERKRVHPEGVALQQGPVLYPGP